MKNTILDNGTQLAVTNKEIEQLIILNKIYYCSDCDCFHIDNDSNWGEVNDIINQVDTSFKV